MKNSAAKALGLAALLLGIQPAFADFTTVFTDSCVEQGCVPATSPGTPQYYGGDGTQAAGDVIGDPANYDILSMTVSQAGSDLVVSVLTRFIQGQPSQTVLYGDLMLSTTGWHPDTSQPYFATDTATTSGTHWNYVVQTTSGTIFHNATLEKSDTAPHDALFRADQYVRYASGNDQTGTAGVSITHPDIPDAVDGSTTVPGTDLTYTIPLAAIGLPAVLANGTEIAMRWTMTCANDIIEAAVTIPEPASLSLFLGGLAGLQLLRRSRRRVAKSGAMPG